MSNNGLKSGRIPKKTLRIVKDKQFPNMHRLEFEGGGRLPENLSGMYGKPAEAQKAIDNWVKGVGRNKIYPQAPKNDIPTKLEQKKKVENNGEEECIS